MSLYQLEETPESFRLQTIANLDDGCGYQWDRLMVWQSMDNPQIIYWIAGAGCSCNDLLSGVFTLADLNRLNKQTLPDLESAIDNWGSDSPNLITEKVELKAKIRRLVDEVF